MKKKIFLVFLLVFYFRNSHGQEFSALDLFKSCTNYNDWIENSFESPVDQQLLFNMGKCQGIMETTGKVMLTLCLEKQRNANINQQLTANLAGIRTITLVKEFITRAEGVTNLQKYNAQSFLSKILSSRWPCK